MPIRIRRHDNNREETRVTDSEGISADLSDESTACYTDRKLNFRALCESIQLVVGQRKRESYEPL